MDPSRSSTRPCLVFLVLSSACLIALVYRAQATFSISSDPWTGEKIIRINPIKIMANVKVKKNMGGSGWGDSWDPWSKGGKTMVLTADFSSGSSGWDDDDDDDDDHWKPKKAWQPPKQSWPSGSWAAGSVRSNSWTSAWNGWNPSWDDNPWSDPWKPDTRVKIKPEVHEVHAADVLIREGHNSKLGINGLVQFYQYGRQKWPTSPARCPSGRCQKGDRY